MAAYLTSEALGQDIVDVKEVFDRFDLERKPNWVMRALSTFQDSGWSKGKLHMGGEAEQHIYLSGHGVKQAEYLIEAGQIDRPREKVPLPAGIQEISGGRVFVSEGAVPSDFPGREGDLHFELAPPSGVDSSAWTGLPKHGRLSAEAVDSLQRTLSDVEKALDESGASNAEKSQARAYVIAIRALAEAPDPPADIIWQIIARANSAAGIAAFFVAVIGLFK